MPLALVVSVGTGTRSDVDIVRPLTKMIRDVRPDYVRFLASNLSDVHAREVARQADLKPDTWTIDLVSDVNDVEAVFRDGLAAIRHLRDLGFVPSNIGVDFTSGTKAMSAGLVLAAVNLGCGSLRYIAGTRREGIVVDGTERFLSFSPTGIAAARQIQLGLSLLLHLQFVGARECCEEINALLLDEQNRALRDDVATLAGAFDAWDKFNHRHFHDEYYKANLAHPELEPFRVASGVPQRLLAIADDIKNKRISEDLLTDLFTNAQRRFREGKYDDALARFYRFTEMLAQYRLQQLRIDTSNVDRARVPPDLVEKYATMVDPRDGKIKIGLIDAYALLAALGDPIGHAFKNQPRLGNQLSTRNKSILAHGTTPIDRTVVERLRDDLSTLSEAAITNFPERRRQLQFPWLID